ncbi:GNAT family N-acetyltransferase, partial [Shewanella sp.]
MIFIASHNIQALGFIQLYPSHSSVSLKPIWYFDDAFVVELYRGTGIAKELIAKAKELADSADVLLIKRTLIDHNVQGKPLAQDAQPRTEEASHSQDSVEATPPVYMYHQTL